MKKKGFTLIELLVVIAIIGVLATIVLGTLGDARIKARNARRSADLRIIQTALELYYTDNGVYPRTSWASSHLPAWENLESQIGFSLPRDPINTTTSTSAAAAAYGGLVYSYFGHSSLSYCNGQAYMLVANYENKVDLAPGVALCDTTRGYGDSIVVGVDKDQNFIGPGK